MNSESLEKYKNAFVFENYVGSVAINGLSVAKYVSESEREDVVLLVVEELGECVKGYTQMELCSGAFSEIITLAEENCGFELWENSAAVVNQLLEMMKEI